ncbi:hypothetical protein [Candidatus Halocynthiibacter alkanivorans]|uniref:hypothetical protein n=1 Tax=Candidatus Halocynthiibacter alkanivorans TaxID=2267619 RepID=UPI000DF47A00|nr:hypothetical protein [Candidatus Halocynthiibacter alkanivorans]
MSNLVNRPISANTLSGARMIATHGAVHSPTIRAMAWRTLLNARGCRFNGQRIMLQTVALSGRCAA